MSREACCLSLRVRHLGGANGLGPRQSRLRRARSASAGGRRSRNGEGRGVFRGTLTQPSFARGNTKAPSEPLAWLMMGTATHRQRRSSPGARR